MHLDMLISQIRSIAYTNVYLIIRRAVLIPVKFFESGLNNGNYCHVTTMEFINVLYMCLQLNTKIQIIFIVYIYNAVCSLN